MTAFEIENNLCKAREISIAKNCVLMRMFKFKGENGGRGNGEWGMGGYRRHLECSAVSGGGREITTTIRTQTHE